MLCVYGNRQNLGTIRKDENALWSLGVHDLSVILYLVDEEPTEAIAHGNAFLNAGRRGRRLLLPPLPERQDRAHAPLVARPAQDAEDHRRRPRQDGRLRRHGARAQGDDLRQGARAARRRTTASGGRAPATSSARRSRTTSRCGSSARTSCALVEQGPATSRGARRARGRARARAAQTSLGRTAIAEIHPTAIVYPGHGARRGREGARARGRRQAADALAALDREARAAAADRARRRHDRLDRRHRVRGVARSARA